jgi:NAD(P)-dependent dehydrogenase (short-subunit alcohol dehydrogenase family)
MLIKPFVCGIERRDADVDDAELADRPVAAEGFDQDCGEGADGDLLAVEFHGTLAFKDKIDFCVLLVVVHLGVLLNVYDVDRGGGVVRHGKRPSGEPTRTSHRLDIVEVSNHIVSHADPVSLLRVKDYPPVETQDFASPLLAAATRHTGFCHSSFCALKSRHESGIFCRNIGSTTRIEKGVHGTSSQSVMSAERVEMGNLFDVKGKVIAITGGGGILCGEMARALGQAGAKIAVLDLSEPAATRVAEEIKAKGGTAMGVACNVLDKASIEQAQQKVVAEFGRVDVLINGAGGNKKEATTSPEVSFFDLPAEAVRFVFDLNFLGTLLPTQVFGKAMAESGSGVILNISSMNAIRPLTKIPAYSAAKAAVSNFTQWLAVHICQNYSKEIRVNAIAPGFFLTEQNRFLLTDAKTGELTPRGKTVTEHTPMARFGQPNELIGTVIWLLSDAAKFVTGVTIPVDGGFSAFSGV